MAQKRTLYATAMEAVEFALTNLHTSTVARVTAVNDTTIDVKPVVNRLVNGREVEMPVFPDVLPLTLQGGGSYIKFPVSVGDSAILIFCERSFDRWYSGDGDGLPYEQRMHDYSDAVAIVGLNPEASAIANVDTTAINGDVNMTGNMDIQGDVSIEGDMSVSGTITCAKLVVNGIDFSTHTHTGDDGGSTSAPLPQG